MKKLGLILIGVFLIATTFSIASGPKTFSWEMPTTNADGSPLTDLSGVRLHCGPSSGAYDVVVDAGNVISYIDDFTLVPVSSERYCVATAYDGSGNEGVYSNEVRIDFLAPGAPVNLTWSN